MNENKGVFWTGVRLPNRPPMKKLFDFDVTLKELENLGKKAKQIDKLADLLQFLQILWYGDDLEEEIVERENRIRIGTVYIFFDENDILHFDFRTRFHLKQYANQFLKIFKDK